MFSAPVVRPWPIPILPVVTVDHSTGVAAAAEAATVSMTGDVSVSPATVAAVPPRDTEVEPIVTEELVSAPFGMLVSPAPDPEN